MEMLGDLPQSLQAITSIVEKFSALVGRAKQDGASEEFTRDLNGAIIEMQGTIIAAQAVALEAQAEQGRLASRIAQLEEATVRSRVWEEEKALYVLASTFDWGTPIAYQLRDEARRDGEPEHFICPNCYEDGMKSILQFRSGFGLRCLKCYRR